LDELAPYDVRPAHYGLLALLEDVESTAQQRLCDAMGINRSNMVVLVDELEQRGLVNRDFDPRDRRRNAIRLTADGRRLLPKLHSVAARHAGKLLAPLSQSEQSALIELLNRLLQ
jgi:DNA-binding MarR family transcriptional regulator